MLALRTQQILGYESGVAAIVDPLAGSYFVESLTDRLEAEAVDLIARIDELGGAVAAIEAGFQQQQIGDAAYDHARAVESGSTVIVGVNRFTVEEEEARDVLRVDSRIEADQVARLQRHRSGLDQERISHALEAVHDAATGDTNLLYPMREALRLGATVGDVSSTLVGVFGRYGRAR